jgi:hypothetical protein
MKPACLEHFTPDAQAKLTDMQCRIIGSPIDPATGKAYKPANQITVDALLQVVTETMRLCHEGHQIEGVEVRHGMPVITLHASPTLHRLAQDGREAIYIAHAERDGRRRATGELLGRACRVQWIEAQ